VFQRHRIAYTVALEVGGWEVIKQYVAMGMGISIVPALCLNDADRERLAARSMKRWFPERSYGVIVRRGKALSAQARAFIELIQPELFSPRDYDQSGHSER
jgi:DNA-binding transcriptional LysR family regulator